jgi:uncharacterized protein
MRQDLLAGLAGLLFSIGLAVAGMTQPHKVIRFLDFFGDWDPSLAMVMVGAIGVNTVVYRLVIGRKEPYFGGRFQLPTRTDIDWRLVVGAVLFGVGWGIAGLCPGPAVASLVGLGTPAVIFLAAMMAGMGIFRLVEGRLPG